ncbi:MAG: hypothetical protein ABEI13_00025 [Candidatus Paceibacteria bacterium]
MMESEKYVVCLRKDDQEYAISAETQVDVMEEVVEKLINDFQLLNQISLPYAMRKNAVLNSSPTHPDGSEMRTYREICENIYINTDLPGRTKSSQLERMASECDTAISFDNW